MKCHAYTIPMGKTKMFQITRNSNINFERTIPHTIVTTQWSTSVRCKFPPGRHATNATRTSSKTWRKL